MAEEKQTPTKAKKGAKKAFFEVRAPITATKMQVYGASEEDFVGKVVKLDLTRILKGKNFEMRLKIANKEGFLEGEPISLELVGSYMRRMMRTGIDYVEDSFLIELKDGKARVKPFFITRNKVSRSVRNELRESAKKFLTEYFKVRGARESFSDVMSNKVQKDLFIKLKKIYPLALCEIRVFELA